MDKAKKSLIRILRAELSILKQDKRENLNDTEIAEDLFSLWNGLQIAKDYGIKVSRYSKTIKNILNY